MRFRRRDVSPGSHRKRATPGCETLEGRAMLSTAAAPAALNAAPAVPHQTPGDRPTTPTVAQGGQYVADTAWNGWKLTHSNNVYRVGTNYGRVVIGHDTRKVGMAYLHAALKGDGKTLDQLGHTRVVKKVGTDFSALSHSRGVKYVGDQFTKFGKSAADGFHRLFGGHTSKNR